MQYVFVALLFLGFLIAQSLIGGAKLVFAIPAYIVVGTAALLSLPALFKDKRFEIRSLPLISACLLTGYIAWRALVSPIPALALPDLLMVLGAFCVYLLVGLHLKSPRARLLLLSGCFLIGFIHVVTGVLQFRYEDDFMLLAHLPDSFPIPQLFRNSTGWRASGFYVCPNHTAGYLESLGAIAIAYCCWGRFSAISRIVLGYVAIYCLVGIALTGSRGGYLSTGFALTVLVLLSMWFLKKLRSSRVGAMMIVSLVVGAALIGGAAYAMSRSATIGNRMGDISYDAGSIRYDMWQAAVKQAKINPVCGTGSGSYLYYGRQLRSPNVQRDPIHAHCDYLELLAEYGVVGCALMLFFVVAHVHAGISAALSILRLRLRATGRSFSNELALLAGALATVAALLAHSVVDFNFHLPANTLFFAAVFGLLACPTTDPALVDSKSRPVFGRLAAFILPVIGGLLIGKSLIEFRGEYHAEWARIHLRNKLFFDNLAAFQSNLGWSLAPMGAGVIAPATGGEMDWSFNYQRNELFPRILAEAEKAESLSPGNIDAPYYRGEGKHFMAVYEQDPAKRLSFHEAALTGFRRGHELFPQDSRYPLKLARTLVNLGRFSEAEDEVSKVVASDPNFGNGYAFFGFVLWQQKKLLRAEAYYRKAVSFPGGNDLANSGLQDVARVRALAGNVAYVEQNGDPLEDFDMEPPTDEDKARGVGIPVQ